jgi:UDP-glucuronate 4-epimerase
MDRILITGAAGFIGSHLSKSLLADGFDVLGVDNMNDYYSPKLKQDRLDILNEYENFRFEKIDISDNDAIGRVFTEFEPHKVVNLAAQAGVRYSISHPHKYMSSNLVGFLNVLDLSRHHDVNGFIYASSSSVYGANEKIPFDVLDRVDKPISLYAASKRANELIAYSYSHLYNLPTTGLRFFTVYGPWGRPDMAMLIFTRKILAGEPIQVFNHGNMKRDFTYIDDIISGTRSALDKCYPCEVFNLGNHKSVHLMEMIQILEEKLGKKAVLNLQPMQPGDVPESMAEISKSKDMLGFQPKTSIELGLSRLVEWYREYYG